MKRDTWLPVVYGSLVFLLSACATAANGASKDDAPQGLAKYADDPRLGEEVSRMCFVSSIDSFKMNEDETKICRFKRDRSVLYKTQS